MCGWSVLWQQELFKAAAKQSTPIWEMDASPLFTEPGDKELVRSFLNRVHGAESKDIKERRWFCRDDEDQPFVRGHKIADAWAKTVRASSTISNTVREIMEDKHVDFWQQMRADQKRTPKGGS